MAFLKILIFLLLLQTGSYTVMAQNSPGQPEFAGDVLLFHDSITTGELKEIHLSSLKGWKFSPKDDPSFSSKDLDDSKWFTISKPLSEEGAVPDSLWNGFGWFRMKVKIDSSFSSSVTFQSYPGSGAVELYINDSLVLKRGNPSPNAAAQKLQPANFSVGEWYRFKPGETYQLAMKYSFHNIRELSFFMLMNPVTDVGIHMFPPKSLDKIIEEEHTMQIVFNSAGIILFMVMVLHLFFFLKIKNDRNNFWIFLITFLVFIFALLININNRINSNNYNLELGLLFITQVTLTIVMGILPLVLHKVLEVKAGIFWKIYTIVPFTVFMGVSLIYSQNILSSIVKSESPPVLLILFTLLGGIVALVKAHKSKRRDMSIVAASFLGFPILLLVAIISFEALDIGGLLLGALIILSILTVIPIGLSLFQAKRFLRLHNQMDLLVENRTGELEQAMQNLQRSNEDLKAAQDQLVQQEKLASLGQLTAGIAHEIKNPLNFVTNFSDLCIELIAEAKAEVQALMTTENKTPDPENAKDNGILRTLKELLITVEGNLEKIYEHGNRADGIVKSMLLHSRGGSGKFQPVMFNALVEEYVRLAYHGMRASPNPIDIQIVFDLDSSIDEVSLITEDFSRVILNLCNNAFDAIREKLKTESFSPRLEVKTFKTEDSIILEIIDNGTGIPDDIKEKILQPFFTTKRGTDGTGLGLSITNDIVKAHGGSIGIESVPGEGAKFIVKIQ